MIRVGKIQTVKVNTTGNKDYKKEKSTVLPLPYFAVGREKVDRRKKGDMKERDIRKTLPLHPS
jgi:hypothetical protein